MVILIPLNSIWQYPGEIKVLAAASKATIPKNQTETTLVIEAAPDATLGEHKLTLNASLKLNNQELKVDQNVLVTLSPGPSNTMTSRDKLTKLAARLGLIIERVWSSFWS